MRREITGFSNPLIKQVRSLREKKHRKREGLFLAEGLRIMTEAREAGFLPEMLFRCADRDSHALEIVLESEVLKAGGDVIETSADILSKLSGKDNAQTVIGVYREHPTPLPDIDRSVAPIWLVAQAMRWVARLHSSGTLEPRRAIGAAARVYLRIPKGGEGAGRVHVDVQGRRIEARAVSSGPEFQTGALARVIDLAPDGALVVAPH